MAFSLEQLSAAFSKKNSNEHRPSNYYPFWNMKDGERAVVRFLPDVNKENPLGFMVDKLMHVLEINGERKSVPCLEMYEKKSCPICKVSSQYFSSEGKESPNGKKYWRKKQHIMQALIVEDPLGVDPETGVNSEGKVKFLNLGFQLYSVIEEAFSSGDLDDVPFLFEGGCDFIIKKSKSGDGQAKYDIGSKFARKASDLTADQIAIVEEESIDLSTLIPANPGHDTVQAMLNASLSGESYTEEADTSKVVVEEVVKAEDVEVKSVETGKPAPDASEFADESDDILAMIRSRKNKSAE